MTNLFGEFFGTMVLLTFGCGVVANVVLARSRGNGGGWIVITAGWAFAVMLGVFAALATGAPQTDLSPAVTLFKMYAGVYEVPHALATMGVQVLGGIAGGVITWLVYLPHWEITEDKGAKLAVFATAPIVRKFGPALLCEAIATCFLLIAFYTIGSKAAQGVAGIPSGLGVYLTAMVIWAVGLSLGGPTGYALNPARDLGPRIAHAILPIPGKGDSDWAYAWVPVVGPMLGATLAFVICRALQLV